MEQRVYKSSSNLTVMPSFTDKLRKPLTQCWTSALRINLNSLALQVKVTPLCTVSGEEGEVNLITYKHLSLTIMMYEVKAFIRAAMEEQKEVWRCGEGVLLKNFSEFNKGKELNKNNHSKQQLIKKSRNSKGSPGGARLLRYSVQIQIPDLLKLI